MERRSFIASLVASWMARMGASAPQPAPPAAQAGAPASFRFDEVAVAGFQYHDGESIWEQLAVGQSVDLVREPLNPYDAEAIRVDWNGRKLGYVPRSRNPQLAILMDQGVSASAGISRLAESRNPWERIELAIGIDVGILPAALAANRPPNPSSPTHRAAQGKSALVPGEQRELESCHPGLTAGNERVAARPRRDRWEPETDPPQHSAQKGGKTVFDEGARVAPGTKQSSGGDRLASLGPVGLIDLMRREEDRVPRPVIDACATHGDRMTTALEKVVDCPGSGDESIGDWWLRLHAAMVLGLIPTERAGLLLVRLMRGLSRAGDDDLQDWLATCWPGLFANKPEAVLEALRDLSLDRAFDGYIRSSATEAIVAAADREGDIALHEALAWVAGIAADEGEDWQFRLMCGHFLLDYPRDAHRALLENLAAKQGKHLVEFTQQEVADAYATGRDDPQWRRFAEPWSFYTPEAIAQRRERWAQERAERLAQLPETYVRAMPKVGRNDPCPCGSGKKHKKCCLAQADDHES